MQVHQLKEYNRILLVATGALMSPVSLGQGESIPAIAHAVIIENLEKEKNEVEENVSVFKYDVNASDIFESTIYDRMHSAENRIDVEIIADYNTENEKERRQCIVIASMM